MVAHRCQGLWADWERESWRKGWWISHNTPPPTSPPTFAEANIIKTSTIDGHPPPVPPRTKPHLKPLDFSSSSRDPFGFDCCMLDLFMLFYFPFFLFLILFLSIKWRKMRNLTLGYCSMGSNLYNTKSWNVAFSVATLTLSHINGHIIFISFSEFVLQF